MKNANNQRAHFLEYGYEEEYDFEKIGQIVQAMDFLRAEAVKNGNRDISIIINSAFNLCFASYYLALRMQQTETEEYNDTID